jgi:hypothetical protein
MSVAKRVSEEVTAAAIERGEALAEKHNLGGTGWLCNPLRGPN